MSASGAGVDVAEKIDVLIVTAVELEYVEALRVETGAWPGSTWLKRSGPTGFEIAFRAFRAKDGNPMRFALTRAHDMGGVETVLAALTAMQAHAPRCLAMCGVCAGRCGDVELGDVIVGKETQVRDLFADGALTQLMPLASKSIDRHEVFRSAAESFASLRKRAAPIAVPLLEDARFDRALCIHMAALAAIEGRPFAADSLMDETLDHEEQFWLVQAHPSLVAGRAQHMFRTRARRASAAFTLIGGVRTRVQAKDLTSRIEGQIDEEMLSLLHDLYPGALQSTGQPGYVGSMEPDLLGEAMVFRTLHGEDDGADALLNHVFQGCDEDAIENGLVALARVSVNHREESSAWIDCVLRQNLAGRALAALNAAKAVSKDSAHALLGMVLAKALEEKGIKEIAERLEEAGIPDGTVSLREVAVWVTSMMLRDLPLTEDVAVLIKRSRLWNNLGVRQSALGQREPALASTEEAVTIYRTLASARPNRFLPALAASLNNLGIKQGELGQREPALASMQEATAIRLTLAAARPDAFLPDLAMSLKNLGTMQSGLGQREPALASTQAAVALYRPLAAARPDAFLPDLATSLNNLGTMQSELDQREPALVSMQEAVATYRTLATARPDVFLPNLAVSLDNLGITQSALGQREPALASTQEAVAICRPLAAARMPFYPTSLGLLATWATGKARWASARTHLPPRRRQSPFIAYSPLPAPMSSCRTLRAVSTTWAPGKAHWVSARTPSPPCRRQSPSAARSPPPARMPSCLTSLAALTIRAPCKARWVSARTPLLPLRRHST